MLRKLRAKFAQNCVHFVLYIRGRVRNLCKYPFSNAPFSEFLITSQQNGRSTKRVKKKAGCPLPSPPVFLDIHAVISRFRCCMPQKGQRERESPPPARNQYTNIRKLEKAVAVSGVCSGVLRENFGKVPGKLLEKFSRIAKCCKF